ncbi:MAG: transposase [Saprospiraceae bacterium]|nr:transposase [Saprospiraceae bacterium]
MKQRKMLSEQQKVAIIEAYLTTGESSRSLGKKHGIDGSTIIYWSNKYKQEVMGQKTKNSKRSKDESTPHSEVNKDLEISRLRKELAKRVDSSVWENHRKGKCFVWKIKKKRHEVI